MKAKVKATGNVVEIKDDKTSLLDYALGRYRDTEGNKYYEEELEFIQERREKYIDWEQRRYEIAKAVLPIFKDSQNVYLSAESAAKAAVFYADALIVELKNLKMMQPGEPICSCATMKGQFQDDERRLPLLPRQNNREKATYANATDEEIRAYIEKKTGQPAPEDMYGLYLLLYGQNEL